MKRLYVVMTNLPGPGARALLEERIDQMVRDGDEGGIRYPLGEAVDAACEFVELEDEDGYGQGPGSGIAFSDHPGSDNLKRLGPFPAPAELAEANRLLGILASEIDRINALGGVLMPGETDAGPGAGGWPSNEACVLAARILGAR